jgi:ribosomal protein S18 acetylase RimI-like enzyme
MYPGDIGRERSEVSAGNIPAIKLYKKSSFRKTSILKNYYKHR